MVSCNLSLKPIHVWSLLLSFDLTLKHCDFEVSVDRGRWYEMMWPWFFIVRCEWTKNHFSQISKKARAGRGWRGKRPNTSWTSTVFPVRFWYWVSISYSVHENTFGVSVSYTSGCWYKWVWKMEQPWVAHSSFLVLCIQKIFLFRLARLGWVVVFSGWKSS